MENGSKSSAYLSGGVHRGLKKFSILDKLKSQGCAGKLTEAAGTMTQVSATNVTGWATLQKNAVKIRTDVTNATGMGTLLRIATKKMSVFFVMRKGTLPKIVQTAI